jgi:hypothetical protein
MAHQGRLAPVVLASLVWDTGLLWAASLYFITLPATLNGASVVISFKEAGLGDNRLMTSEASAEAMARFIGVTHSSQCPDAANKPMVSGPVTGKGEFRPARMARSAEASQSHHRTREASSVLQAGG